MVCVCIVLIGEIGPAFSTSKVGKDYVVRLTNQTVWETAEYGNEDAPNCRNDGHLPMSEGLTLGRRIELISVCQLDKASASDWK